MYNTIEVAKLIVIYIYKHKVNMSLRRVHKKKKKKKFIASHFFMLISLLEVESELQALDISILTLCSGREKQLNGVTHTMFIKR
jgi:translation initiation factor 2 alpha subunit (eIF-2alpha)